MDGDVCPGPIRVLRTTRAPCIAAFGNLEPARAALMQLRALVGSGEWRWQRQLERALSLLNLWRCHESQSVASTAQQTRTAPHRKSARSSWGTVELICRRRFSTKNLRRYTVRVTRSPPRAARRARCSLLVSCSVCLLSSHVARRRGASGRREMLLTACHGIVTGLCVYVCVRFHYRLRDWERHALHAGGNLIRRCA